MRLPNFITRLTQPRRRTSLALSSNDGFYEPAGSAESRDRFTYDRQEILRQVLEAWRTNPLARRLVELTSQYVVGGGITLGSPHPGTHRFLDAWWNHPYNQMPVRVFELCDELSRSGELFLLISTGADGMSYLRPVPACEIAEITCTENDTQQELSYLQRGLGLEAERCWPAYNPFQDLPDEQGRFQTVMVHYAINRPAGALRGESDLAPVLRWLVRYSAWLEDRARLNRFRQAFLFVVRSRFTNEAERQARQAALNAAPPPPGSILVADTSEEWSVIAPRLESAEAAEDGLALKKMIAAGCGIPLHFLAEPESATRTTAESAGGPTFRRFEQRQVYFLWMMQDLARLAARRRALVYRLVDGEAPIEVRGADISARDNPSLSVAAATIASAMRDLRDRGLVDDQELLRLVYKFAGEVVDVEGILERGRQEAAARWEQRAQEPSSGGRSPSGIRVDPATGEAKEIIR